MWPRRIVRSHDVRRSGAVTNPTLHWTGPAKRPLWFERWSVSGRPVNVSSLSTMNRGSLSFDDRIDPQRLAEHLADALRRVHAKDVSVSADRVSFAGGIFRFVSNWNVLVPFGHGELTINRSAKRLEYKVSFGQLALILVVFSMFAAVFMLASRFPPGMFLVGLAMIWLWIGGMNVLIGRVRFESFLRKTIDAAAVRAGG